MTEQVRHIHKKQASDLLLGGSSRVTTDTPKQYLEVVSNAE